jgi:hypothetical protein
MIREPNREPARCTKSRAGRQEDPGALTLGSLGERARPIWVLAGRAVPLGRRMIKGATQPAGESRMIDESRNRPNQRRPPAHCVHCRGTGKMEVVKRHRNTGTRPCRYCDAGTRRRTPKPCDHCKGSGLMQLVKTDGRREPYPCLYCPAGLRMQRGRTG